MRSTASLSMALTCRGALTAAVTAPSPPPCSRRVVASCRAVSRTVSSGQAGHTPPPAAVVHPPPLTVRSPARRMGGRCVRLCW